MEQTGQSLIRCLQDLPGIEDLNLFKRAEARVAMRTKAMLDLQRDNGEVFAVTVLDVSESGVGFLCRKSLGEQSRIGLRLAFQHESQFEHFQVQRETATIGGYKIGAKLTA